MPAATESGQCSGEQVALLSAGSTDNLKCSDGNCYRPAACSDEPLSRSQRNTDAVTEAFQSANDTTLVAHVRFGNAFRCEQRCSGVDPVVSSSFQDLQQPVPSQPVFTGNSGGPAISGTLGAYTEQAIGGYGWFAGLDAGAQSPPLPLDCASVAASNNVDNILRPKNGLSSSMCCTLRCLDPKCGRSLNDVAGLRAHNEIVHLQSFHCTEPGCNRSFKASRTLKRHAHTVHSVERTLFCPHIGCEYALGGAKKGFNRRDTRQKHLRRRHNGKNGAVR